jgi:hypothetical protein
MQNARIHIFDNVANFLQPCNNMFVAIHEAQATVLDTCGLCKILYKLLTPSKVVARHSWEQMVHSLELQATVEPVKPLWAVDVHGCAELVLGERLGGPEVRRWHTPMREGDLDVENDCDDV